MAGFLKSNLVRLAGPAGRCTFFFASCAVFEKSHHAVTRSVIDGLAGYLRGSKQAAASAMHAEAKRSRTNGRSTYNPMGLEFELDKCGSALSSQPQRPELFVQQTGSPFLRLADHTYIKQLSHPNY